MTTPLVSFNHLSVSFAGERSRVRAVQEVSFTIQAGQTVGVVGESGCGKSVTAMALMGLLPPQTARIDGGEIRFADRDLLRLKARQMAEQVVVMYAGRIVEQGATAEVLRHPQHPYTRGLIASRPVPGERRRRLYSIPGQVPDLAALPAGCAFAGRCERATARCREAIPPLLGDRQRAACFYSEFAEVTA